MGESLKQVYGTKKKTKKSYSIRVCKFSIEVIYNNLSTDNLVMILPTGRCSQWVKSVGQVTTEQTKEQALMLAKRIVDFLNK